MHNRKKRCFSLLITICCALFLPLLASADCLSTKWPQEKGDLIPDPSITYGRLDNGFRYVLKKNKEPENRVAMSLYVQAGSLHEDDDQRGIAHFLEHMLFNGSVHFRPGELVNYFQSIGMSFGGDTNAHTGYDETVYDIILPDGSKEDVEKGLLVLADYARGASLLPREIERERGVILAEKRSRDSAAYRAHIDELNFSMRGTRVPERVIIGILETINGVDHDIMKRFYDAWYRPDNMVLVMVGDFNQQMVVPLIREKFEALQAAGAPPVCPDLGQLVENKNPEFYYHFEREMGHAEIGIETHWNSQPQNDSALLEKEELEKYLGVMIVQHRLDELAKRRDVPFRSAKMYAGTFLNRFSYGELSASCEPDKWGPSLTLLENSLRQVLKYGFSDAEFSRVKKELMVSLDSAVLTQKSRNSKELASDIIRSLNENRVMRSPEQERAFFATILDSMKRSDVEKAFRAIWDHPSRLVKLNGKSVVEEESPLQAIAKTYKEAALKEVSPFEQATAIHFPYLFLTPSVAQPIISSDNFTDIESKRVVFANGVILNYKKTDFQENEVQVVMDFGLGKSGAPVPGLAMLADAVIPQSGTGKLSAEDMEKILSSSSVKTNFHVGASAFEWQTTSLNMDLERSFQLCQHLLADPGVDKDAFAMEKERLKLHYDALAGDVRGIMQQKGSRFLAGGNPFFGIPNWNEISTIDHKQLEHWFVPAAKSGSLEVSVVGDFDEDQMLKIATKYFAALPKRMTQTKKENTATFPAGQTLALTVPSSIDKALLVVAWKTDDFWDISRTRGLHLLAEIFQDKLREVVREKLGATYSPQVYNISSRTYKGYGVLQAVLLIDPEQIERVKKEVLLIAEKVHGGEFGEKELKRIKGPMLTSLKDMVMSNRYWIGSVLSLSERYPQQLSWPLTILPAFANMSLDDIKLLGRAYLSPDKAAVVTVVPSK